MNAINVNCRIDTRNWLAAHDLLHRSPNSFSKTVPSEALAKAVAFVVHDAKNHTPHVNVATIEAELAVSVTPAVLKSGKLSLNKRRQREVVTANETPVGRGDFKDVPLAWLLIGARAKQTSEYSVSTSWRWYINQGVHPLKGHRVSEFKAIMAAYVSRMAKGRFSSTHFFQQSWNAVLSAVIPFVPHRFKSSMGRWVGRGQTAETLGHATMTGNRTANPTIRIENRMGLEGRGDALNENRNAAAHRILGPVLQSAIDRNFHEQMQIAAQRGLLDYAPRLKALGFNVT